MKAILTLVLTLATYSSHAIEISDPGDSDSSTPIHEVLMGFLSSPEGVTFQVAANPCVEKENFSILIQESFPPTLYLIRKDLAVCSLEPLPYGKTIFYSNSELGISDNIFNIGNEILPGVQAVIQE